jgi:hypothetical protein
MIRAAKAAAKKERQKRNMQNNNRKRQKVFLIRNNTPAESKIRIVARITGRQGLESNPGIEAVFVRQF